MLSGTVISKGCIFGQAWVMQDQSGSVTSKQITPGEVQAEIERFQLARSQTIEKLQHAKLKAGTLLDEDKQQIFTGHMLLLEDPELEFDVIAGIRERLLAAESAAKIVFDERAALLDGLKDAYLRERASDIRQLGELVVKVLLGYEDQVISLNAANIILVARDLSPAETIQLDFEKVKGLLTDLGGETSHTSILARSLDIPAIVGVAGAASTIRTGDFILLDAIHNRVIINPDTEVLANYESLNQQETLIKANISRELHFPTVTLDGHQIVLAANLGSPPEGNLKQDYGAEGVGLFRTEFIFMNRDKAPAEEEQFSVYKQILESLPEQTVIFRTMDIGGDKSIPWLNLKQEDNPFLGCRGIRLALKHQDVFVSQLRALLRASAYGKMKIMFPMISSVDEIKKVREILHDLIEELNNQGCSINNNIPIGIMIETPAAVAIAHHLVKYVDFFSIGTNDLTQYVLAVDRCNSEISDLFQSHSPSVLLMIKQLVDVSKKHQKWVGVCGEMAANDSMALLLLGMGLDELSMSPGSIGRIKYRFRRTSYAQAQSLCQAALGLETAKEVLALLSEFEQDNALS